MLCVSTDLSFILYFCFLVKKFAKYLVVVII